MQTVLADLNGNLNFPHLEKVGKRKLENEPHTKNIHQALIDGCLKNDADAQRQIYDLYSVAIFNTCKRILANREEAQDILQDSFIDAFKGIAKYSGKSTFGAWLKKIAIHKCIYQLKKQKRMEFERLAEKHERKPEEDDDFPELSIQAINQAILKLPDGCRMVFVLKAMEEYDHKEIAEELKISVGTSKSQFSRAKQLLQDLLKVSSTNSSDANQK